MQVPHQEQYPQAVCPTCYDQACDAHGQTLRFFNVSMSGGFGAVIADSHVCYIEGVACWADEARFGGIVIQPYNS
jgi:hypothetical protein